MSSKESDRSVLGLWPRVAIIGALALLAWALGTVLQRGGGELAWWERYTPERALAVGLSAACALAALFVLARGRGIAKRLRAVVGIGLGGAFALALVEAPAVFLGHDYQFTLGTLADNTFQNASLRTNALDPELIHIHHPNSSFVGEVRGNLCRLGVPPDRQYQVELHYDAHGFRNATAPEAAEVVVIGDSFVEAALMPTEDMFTTRLGALTGAQVANLGQSGYGFKQELAVLERFGLPLKPHTVVWMLFGGNDFRDVASYEKLSADFDAVVQSNTARLRDRLFVTSLTRLALRGLRSEGLSDLARRKRGLFEDASGETTPVYFSQVEPDPSERDLEVGLGTLGRAGAAVESIGARMLLVYIPRKFRVYRDQCEFDPDSITAEWTPPPTPELLADWCAEEGLAFLDLTPALIERLRAGEHVYLPDDTHWNAVGHAVGAEAVAAELDRLGWSSAAVH